MATWHGCHRLGRRSSTAAAWVLAQQDELASAGARSCISSVPRLRCEAAVRREEIPILRPVQLRPFGVSRLAKDPHVTAAVRPAPSAAPSFLRTAPRLNLHRRSFFLIPLDCPSQSFFEVDQRLISEMLLRLADISQRMLNVSSALRTVFCRALITSQLL